MNIDSQQLEKVKEEIVAAFSTKPYPGDEKIVYGDLEECLEVKQILENLRWQDVPASVIGRNDWSLSFFSPLGYCYYLPAYLIYSLENVEQPDVTCDSTLFSLMHISGRLRHLSKPQRRAIKHFIEFLRDHRSPDDREDVQEALEYYWSRVK